MQANQALVTESAAARGKSWRKAVRDALYLGSALAVLATPSLAAAQEGEIVVTGQRRAQLLEDVPASVVALDAENLENAGIINMHEIGQITPGVQVNFAGAYTQPAIRGVSTLTNGNGVENNVALYVDGYYEPSNILVNMDLANLQSIEILKGPQGTLYGRNATGGAILLNTLRPSDTLTGNIEATYASFEDRRLTGYLSGPLSDRARFGVSAYWRDMNGYLELSTPPVGVSRPDDAVPLEQRSLRARLELDVTDTLVATLAYNYTYNDDARGILFTPYEHLSATVPAPPARATQRDQVSFNAPTALETSVDQLTLTLDWDLDIGRLTSHTGYAIQDNVNQFDTDGYYTNVSNSLIEFNEDTFQQSLDLEIDTFDHMNLLVGAMYYWDDTSTDPSRHISNYVGGVLTTVNDSAIETEAISVYADATIDLTPSLSVTLGGRYSHEEKEAFFVSNNVVTSVVLFPATTKSAEFDEFTPRASIRWEFAPHTSVYASYSRGFRSGTFSLSGATSPATWNAVDPEIIDGYEIGFKTVQNRYRFETAAFYYDYSDLHVSSTQPNLAVPGSFFTVFQNAESAEAYGVDALLDYEVTDDFHVRLGVAWLNAEYGNFPGAIGTGLNSITGFNVANQVQDWSGLDLARSPELSGNLGIVYNTTLFGGDLQLAANAAYTDDYIINNPSVYGPAASPALQRVQRYVQEGYTLLNANAEWTDPSGHYHIAFYGNNLTDEEYLIISTGGPSGDRGNTAPPANYGVRIGYEF